MIYRLGDQPPRGFRWQDGLLGEDDPDPVGHEKPVGRSDFLLICDHAGNVMPRALGHFGLTAVDFHRHYAYDIGALGVSQVLSELLDAELLYQRYSRLLIDCNRAPHSIGAFVTQIDGVRIAANETLDQRQIASRIAEVFHPYQARIQTAIAQRLSAGRPPVVVSVHSFTPSHSDFPAERPWHIGVLFNRDGRYAKAVIDVLHAEKDLVVGINEPYGVDEDGDYAVPVYCEHQGLMHVELELRQDLIADADGQRAWGERLARILSASLKAVGLADGTTADKAESA